ncbi:MAG: bile acid:sodium symporter [Pseudomonadota bacterium]
MDSAELDAVRIVLSPATQSVLPLILAMIMFSVALSLRLEDFAFLKRAPLRFAGAAAGQIILLPAATFALLLVLDPIASIALGMIVVACCPGGNVSNFFTHLARGDTALSVSLTATSSVLAALMTPVSILFWASLYPPTAQLITEIEVEAAPFLIQTTAILAIPLALGMTVCALAPRLAARIRPTLTVLSLAALALIAISGVRGNWDIFIAGGLLIVSVCALHNAFAFALGWIWARVLGFAAKARRSLTFEIGIQNAGLGLVILLGQFDGLGGAAAVTAIWGIWHLISGSALAGGFRLLDRVSSTRLS